jgi:hemoglobin/transferrin/lactoferrin receptor protein
VSVGDGTGDGRTDFVKRNLAEGEVKGLELEGGVDVTREVSLFTDAAWALGDVQTIVNGRRAMRPLSKVNPAMLHLGARWKPEGSAFWLEGLVTSARVQDRLSPSDETDLQRIPYGGTPGYTIYTLRLGYRFSEAFRASLALENITDKDYRAHGSGQNEAGTNAVIGVEARY